MTTINQTDRASAARIVIHASREAAQASNPMVSGYQLIECFKRTPSRYAGAWIPPDALPDTSTVPAQFKPIVDAAISKAATSILDDRAFSGDYEPTWAPADTWTPDTILTEATSARSSGQWITKDELHTGWAQSATLRGFNARMLALPAGAQRKERQRAIDEFSDDVCKLTAKNASLHPERAMALLSRLEDVDLSTTWGDFAARRLADLAAKPVPPKHDVNAL